MSRQGKKILFISLTRSGSIAYASAMAQSISHVDPIIISSIAAAKSFYKTDIEIKTYSGIFSFLTNSLSFFFKAANLLSSFRDSDDVIVYFPVFHPWNFIVALWAGIYSLPVVTTIHDYHTHEGEKSKLTEWLQKLQLSISDIIIFLTDYQKQKAILDFPSKGDQFMIIPHPLIPSHVINDLDHSNQMKFLFIGRLKTYKGLHLILESSESHEINSITIAGQGDQINPLRPNVTYINRLMSDLEISNLLSCHHVLLLPYLATSQSGVVTLGIDANIPMIITDLPGLREQLDDNCGIWISANSSALLNAMKSIQDDEKKYKEIKYNLNNYKAQYADDFKIQIENLLEKLHKL